MIILVEEKKSKQSFSVVWLTSIAEFHILSAATWIRVSVLAIGALVYAIYGRKHSSLSNAVYVPLAYANEIYLHSSGSLA